MLRSLASPKQIEQISQEVERLAGDEMTPYVRRLTGAADTERYLSWYRDRETTYQAEYRKISSGPYTDPTVQEVWRFGRYSEVGRVATLPLLMQVETDVVRMNSNKAIKDLHNQMRTRREQYPTTPDLHQDTKVMGSRTSYITDLYSALDAAPDVIEEVQRRIKEYPSLTQGTWFDFPERPAVLPENRAYTLFMSGEQPINRSQVRLICNELRQLSITDRLLGRPANIPAV